MKISFSLPSKSSSKPNRKASQKFESEDQDDKETRAHEYVTEFDASKTLVSSQPKKLVIPPQQNEWRPQKKLKNIDLPGLSANQDLQFEVEAPGVAESVDSAMSYGLILRQTNKDKSDAITGQSQYKANDDERPRSAPVEIDLLQKFKEDLRRLPDDQGFEEFNDVSVADFSAAILAGYGWYEGRGIGKNPNGDVKVKQYEKRTAKEGLGFVSDRHGPDSKKDSKNGRDDKEGFFVGKDVRIVGGPAMGFRGRIVEILSGDSMVLKLLKSGEREEVRANVRDLAELGSKEEEKCLMKLKDLKSGRLEANNRSNEESSGKDKTDSRRKEIKRSREEERPRQVSWLASHIRVRIISKEYKGGRFYLKKGEIVDVVGPTECDIIMDGSRELIQGVDQDLLETALPRRGGAVLVLYGKHKGVFGNLVERDMDKETGVVRDADTHALLNVKLKQIAEYVGDLSHVGY